MIGNVSFLSKVEPAIAAKLTLCLDPVLGAVASVSQPTCAAPSKTDMPPRLRVTLAEVLAEPRSSSGQTQKHTLIGGSVRSGFGCGSNGDGTHRGSHLAADQEEKGSSRWATTPTCSAFYTVVTSALESSLRRTRRECGRTC